MDARPVPRRGAVFPAGREARTDARRAPGARSVAAAASGPSRPRACPAFPAAAAGCGPLPPGAPPLSRRREGCVRPCRHQGAQVAPRAVAALPSGTDLGRVSAVKSRLLHPHPGLEAEDVEWPVGGNERRPRGHPQQRWERAVRSLIPAKWPASPGASDPSPLLTAAAVSLQTQLMPVSFHSRGCPLS